MNINATQPGDTALPTDRPMDTLMHDHQYVRQLFEYYLNTNDMEVKKEAGPEIIRTLEQHADLEEAVFYPKVRSVAPDLVDRCEQEHQEARQLIGQLKSIDIMHPQCDQLFRQLADSVLNHVETEEQQLFSKVQQSGIDLGAIGLEMQAFEANMIGAQVRSPDHNRMHR